MGDGSPGSREAEGEGGEGFSVAQSGRCPDLLVIWGGKNARNQHALRLGARGCGGKDAAFRRLFTDTETAGLMA
jgi:hypothetical protein